MPVISTSLVMADDFVGRKGWATSYGKKILQPMLYCKGEITMDDPLSTDTTNPYNG